jgi:hypothetical protein
MCDRRTFGEVQILEDSNMEAAIFSELQGPVAGRFEDSLV